MKNRKLLLLALAVSLFGGGAFSTHSLRAAGGVQILVGRITQMTKDRVTIDDVHSFKFQPAKAQCFDFRAARTTCETLVAIGYADQARVTVLGGVVQRIDIIELQQ